MGLSTLVKLSAVCLISSTVPSAMALSAALNAAQAMGLLSRQTSTCSGLSGYTPCNQGLPSDFCCGPSTTCLAFNSGQSVICCPQGRDCNNILPIPCDINNLNATAFPSNPLHTIQLGATLPTCGTNTCCPVGYTCQNNQCFLAGTASSSITSTPTSTQISSSSSPTVFSLSSTTPAIIPNVANSTPTTTSSISAPATNIQANAFPPVAIIAGFIPGIVVGVLITILIIICYGRRRHSKQKDADLSHVTATVSDPIYNGQGTTRTDFLRRASKSRNTNTTQGSPGNRASRVRSLFSRSPTLARDGTPTGGFGNVAVPKTPKTPENRMGNLRKEPSLESIKIYSPPHERLAAVRQTTFTDMLHDAGLRPDEPYLKYMGNPRFVDPRRREGNGSGALR